MPTKTIILDANILIRAVLGKRVRELIINNSSQVLFFAPDVAYADAKKYLPQLLSKRGMDIQPAMDVLEKLEKIVISINSNMYQHMEMESLERISSRDIHDWPVVACALLFECPIWTEDKDFFGTGVATWSTDRVSNFFKP